MKEIPLTQGKVALVDDEDYEALNQYKWYAKKYSNTIYAFHTFREKDGKQINLGMHRIIMGINQEVCVDHIDGNGLNNQRSNLRIVTIRQNCQNNHSCKTSIYPGVSWEKHSKKWRPRLYVEGENKSLGLFESEINAFRAYYDAVLELGETVVGFSYPEIPEDEIEIPNSNLPKAVIGISVTNPNEIIYFSSSAEAGKNGFSQPNISSCCCGKRKKHKGYYWQWLNNQGEVAR